jgi:hypothetical protein
LAGFQVTLIGRFWVTPEAMPLPPDVQAAKERMEKAQAALLAAKIAAI